MILHGQFFIELFMAYLTATVFDKNIDRQTTLGNDGTTDNGELILLDFKALGETMFRGKVRLQ